MSGGTEVAVDLPPLIPSPAGEFDPSLDIELLDTPFMSGGSDGVLVDDLDFDFSFDDLCLPSSDVLEDLLRPSHPQQPDLQPEPDPDFSQFAPNFYQFDGVIKSTSPELRHAPGDCGFSGDHSWDSSGLLNSASPEMESHQISGYLNMPSPESNRDSTGNCDADSKGLNCPSPESQGSGNFGSNVSEDSNDCTARSVSSTHNSSNSSIKIGDVDQSGQNSLLKRKKEGEDSLESCPETKNVKYRKSRCSSDNNTGLDACGLNEEEEKRKIRLMRNRESAQLSRQRKKHYIEELEDKVRNMHSTIQDLNMKISYVMAENVTLRQQAGGPSGGGSAAAATPPPMVPPPPPGIYPPHPAMMYPWMPCAPPYMMKAQGSQVPLVPIPRLKPQQPVQAPKENKKVKNRKSDSAKTKKVAGVSFLGLLFFIMLFGGLVPMVNVRFGGVREAFTGGETYSGSGFNEKHHGRVLMVNGSENSEKHGGRRDFSNSSIYCDDKGCGNCRGESSGDEFVRLGNGSEHLAASLYVPRNDKLIKIDGNLIIHSVLASEKATMASHENEDGETSLAFRGNLVPAVPVPDAARNGGRHQQLRALGSASADKDGMKPPATDGRLQQWFREGLAGPMMSSGMCTEVFQFDVSAAIVPVSATRNLSEPKDQNSTQPNKGKNRRILHPIPLPGSGLNITTDHAGGSSKKDNLSGNKNASSMVVSVLFDPREAGDADLEGVIGTKSLSRIFVVVLIDNVRYVTYSCMLPFKGIANHLVTA